MDMKELVRKLKGSSLWVLRLVDKLLSALPLNGKKTTVGAVLLVVAQLVPALAPYVALLGVANVAVTLGLIHKAVKAVIAQAEGREIPEELFQ